MLSNLDSDSATGPDGISLRVLKNCSAALAHPICSIHTHLLKILCHRLGNQQTLPLYIKKYKGAKIDPFNCRPIGLVLIIGKVMESIIASDIKSFLFSNGLISDHQFGFSRVEALNEESEPLGLCVSWVETKIQSFRDISWMLLSC